MSVAAKKWYRPGQGPPQIGAKSAATARNQEAMVQEAQPALLDAARRTWVSRKRGTTGPWRESLDSVLTDFHVPRGPRTMLLLPRKMAEILCSCISYESYHVAEASVERRCAFGDDDISIPRLHPKEADHPRILMRHPCRYGKSRAQKTSAPMALVKIMYDNEWILVPP